MEFAQQIKDALKKFGLDEKHWTKITLKTGAVEADVEPAVIKYWSGEPDRRATEATKTVNEKKQAEIDALDKKNKELEAELGKSSSSSSEGGDDKPLSAEDIAAIVQKSNAPLLERLDAIDKSKSDADSGKVIAGLIKDAGLKPGLSKYIHSTKDDTEDTLKEKVLNLKEEWGDNGLIETDSNPNVPQSLSNHRPKVSPGGPSGGPSDAAVKEFAKNSKYGKPEFKKQE